jgi:uncharacterized membrane protein
LHCLPDATDSFSPALSAFQLSLLFIDISTLIVFHCFQKSQPATRRHSAIAVTLIFLGLIQAITPTFSGHFSAIFSRADNSFRQTAIAYASRRQPRYAIAIAYEFRISPPRYCHSRYISLQTLLIFFH